MAILVCVIILVGAIGIVCAESIAEFVYNHPAYVKKLLLCIVAVATILAAFAFLPPAKAEVDFYPASMVVVDFSVSEGTILLEDGEGNLFELYWEFEDDDQIELGDIFSLLMWEAGTPTYRIDDEILDAVNSRIKAR